jgi:hypothetical protein
MATAVGKFARWKGGRGFFAEVAVEVESPSVTPGVELRLTESGWILQCYIEDIPVTGDSAWNEGARIGAEYALSVANTQSARVVITRIAGMATDTNPTVVGAATALAVWAGLSYTPTAEHIARFETVVFNSWRQPPDALPQFV